MSVRARHLIPLLAGCSAFGSVGNFLFLPALPQIANHYGVGPGTAALAITAYLVAFAFGVLLSGPLADRYGRRPVLIGGVALTGFAAVAWKWASTRGARVAHLEDLFVDPEARRGGIGAALIEECGRRAKHHGAPCLLWITALDNHRAQSVYERVGAHGEQWLEYELELE